MANFHLNLSLEYKLKIYRGLMNHDNEEWYKIWRGIDLSFQNLTIWRISTRALKSLKNLHFNGLLLNKVYNVWAKKVQRSMFHDTEEWCKIWRKTDFWLGNDMRNLANFYQSTRKSQNWDFWWHPFIQSKNGA